MNVRQRRIDIDADVADLLEARAAARGLSVSDLLADLAGSDPLEPALAKMRGDREGPWAPGILAEDVRRVEAFRKTREGILFDEVRAWMATWGTSRVPAPPRPRKL